MDRVDDRIRDRLPPVGGEEDALDLTGADFTKTKLTFVPYRGAGPAMLDLVAGTIDMMCDQSSNSLPQVHSGSVKAFAVTAPQRLAAAVK